MKNISPCLTSSNLSKLLVFIVLFCPIILIIFSCNRKNLDKLIGINNKPGWQGKNPKGYIYVPSGTLHIGYEQDISKTFIQRPKFISIQGFYMSQYEVTNKEYREFVYWVRDSIAHSLLDHYIVTENGDLKIDWEYQIDWEDEVMNELFVKGTNNLMTLDINKLVFEYEWYDWKSAALDRGRSHRNSFIKRDEVKVHPMFEYTLGDTTKLDSLGHQAIKSINYFWHPAYDDYPVVGVTWHQATAYCYWKTQQWNAKQSKEGNFINTEDFRLPTEHEWSYAAAGGSETNAYPWAGAYYSSESKKNSPKLIYNCNGGVLKDELSSQILNPGVDGFDFTAPVNSFTGNDYGLYQMAGNVAEWVSSDAFVNSSVEIENVIRAYWENQADSLSKDSKHFRELLPDYPFDRYEGYKIIKGGSWQDPPYYMQIDNKKIEKPDAARSFIGFRPIMTFLGRSLNDF